MSRLLQYGILGISLSLSTLSIANTSKINIDKLTITQAQQLMKTGELTSKTLVSYYIDKINLNQSSPYSLNAVATINAKAIDDAIQKDKARQNGEYLGPLHGIPVLLKDNIDTGDGMPNTAGSLALKNHKPNNDAFFVQKLRDAGAIILGKTNLSEWANFRSTRSSSGWSGIGGQVKNPYDLSVTPCGSSSGSGVAVAASLTMLAVGTETDGSVTCPASINGIVGIKPSLGTVSRSGIVPIAHSQDTAGPMARTVSDATLLLNAMVGFDDNDPSAIKTQTDFTKHLNLKGLTGKRIGIISNLMGYHDQVDSLFNQAVKVLEKRGATVVSNIEFPKLDEIGNHEFTILLYEFKHDLNQYFANNNLNMSLASLIEFNKNNKSVEMPYFNQEIFVMAQKKGPLTDEDYQKALSQAKLLSGKQGIDALLKKHNLDILIAPTTHAAWSIDKINGDHYLGAASTPAAVSGYPHITVPMGYVHHLPVGISFFGANLSEGILIEAAYDFEQATKHRQPPKFH